MNRTRLTLNDLTGQSCEKVFQDVPYSLAEINWSRYSPKNDTWLLPETSPRTFYSPCECSTSQSRFVCPTFPSAPTRRLISNDRLLNITREENEILYYLYTTDLHHLDRYGGLSFGLLQDYIPDGYPLDGFSPEISGEEHRSSVHQSQGISHAADLSEHHVESHSPRESSERERSCPRPTGSPRSIIR